MEAPRTEPNSAGCTTTAAHSCAQAARYILKNNTAQNQSSNLLSTVATVENFNRAWKRILVEHTRLGLDAVVVNDAWMRYRQNPTVLVEQIAKETYCPGHGVKAYANISPVNPSKRNRRKAQAHQTSHSSLARVYDYVVQQALVNCIAPSLVKNAPSANTKMRIALDSCVRILNEGYDWCVRLDVGRITSTALDRATRKMDGLLFGDSATVSLTRRLLNEDATSIGALAFAVRELLLVDLDDELTTRNHQFARVEGSLVVFTKSKRAALRVRRSVERFVMRMLGFDASVLFTEVTLWSELEFCGFSFRQGRVPCISDRAVSNLKDHLKHVTSRSNALSNAKRATYVSSIVRSWSARFSWALSKKDICALNEWLAVRIRMVLWKQWKLVRTRRKALVKLGLSDKRAAAFASTRKGYWACACDDTLKQALPMRILQDLGYSFFSFAMVG